MSTLRSMVGALYQLLVDIISEPTLIRRRKASPGSSEISLLVSSLTWMEGIGAGKWDNIFWVLLISSQPWTRCRVLLTECRCPCGAAGTRLWSATTVSSSGITSSATRSSSASTRRRQGESHSSIELKSNNPTKFLFRSLLQKRTKEEEMTKHLMDSRDRVMDRIQESFQDMKQRFDNGLLSQKEIIEAQFVSQWDLTCLANSLF